jgi:FSR family fosmidomycin resistance protein-like MFS transporter
MDRTASNNDNENGFQAGRAISLSLGHAVHDTYTAFLNPLLPLFIETMSITKAGAGLLRVFMQWPSLSQPFIGRLADRTNLRYLVILAPAVTATLMSLLGVANSYAMLALFLILVGFSSASMHAVGPVLTGTVSGRNLGRGMSFWMVGGELGRTLGPLIIVGAVQFLGLAGTPWLMIAGLLASGVLYFLLRDIPTRSDEALPQANWWSAIGTMGPLLLPLSGIILSRSFLAEAITTYLPIFLREEGAELWLAGVALTVVEAAGVLGALLGGSLSDRLGRRRMLLISISTGPILMLLFLAVTIWPPVPGPWVQFPLLSLLGLTQLSITPVIMAVVQESYPENRALANGAYMAVSFVLRSLITLVVGLLGDHLGLQATFAMGAFIQLLSLPLVRLLPPRKAEGVISS